MAKPFFVRFLENQLDHPESVQAGKKPPSETMKYPADNHETRERTYKYPSDLEEVNGYDTQ